MVVGELATPGKRENHNQMKLSERQLRQMQANAEKRTRRRPSAIGDLARELLESPAFRKSGRNVQVIDVLAAAFPELMRQVRVGGIRAGVLRLEVDTPAIAYDLRLRWEQRLLGLLQDRLPGRGVFEVRFLARPGSKPGRIE